MTVWTTSHDFLVLLMSAVMWLYDLILKLSIWERDCDDNMAANFVWLFLRWTGVGKMFETIAFCRVHSVYSLLNRGTRTVTVFLLGKTRSQPAVEWNPVLFSCDMTSIFTWYCYVWQIERSDWSTEFEYMLTQHNQEIARSCPDCL